MRCSVFGRRPSSPIKNKLDPLVYRRVCAGMAHIFHFFPLSAARPTTVTSVRKKCNPNKKNRPIVCLLPPRCYGARPCIVTTTCRVNGHVFDTRLQCTRDLGFFGGGCYREYVLPPKTVFIFHSLIHNLDIPEAIDQNPAVLIWRPW